MIGELFRLVSGDQFEGGVGVQDIAICIGDHHTLSRLLDGCGQAALRLLEPDARYSRRNLIDHAVRQVDLTAGEDTRGSCVHADAALDLPAHQQGQE